MVTAVFSAPLFRFRDVTQEAGLLGEVQGMRGHAAGWGDANGDGRVDLYVGSFDTGRSRPNLLLTNRAGSFVSARQGASRLSSRPTGTVFADFDNDGDLDLYVASMPAPKGSPLAERAENRLVGCRLLRNEGNGRFRDISGGNGSCPEAFGGRSATVFDYDGDGRLDLLVGEDPLTGYNGSPTHSSRLFHNEGDLQFQDVTQAAGIPEGIPALGVAAADVNNDTWPDFFLACHGPGNRLFLNEGDGTFSEAPGTAELFDWKKAGGDNMVCGVAFGDVNTDGLLDLVLGQHFEQPWTEPVPNRLFLNQGIKAGVPRFREVTEAAGLDSIPMKAPHVELRDFDNDGRVDLYTSVVKFADGRPHPLIFRNVGSAEGIPRFRQHALTVNDFPTKKDRAIKDSGRFFEKMISEKKILYAAAGPSCDYDRDGRLDLFLTSWWPERSSLLLNNETESGCWLQVKVCGLPSINRMGVGSRVRVYKAGKLGDEEALLGVHEIAVGYGYASSHQAVAHFGLDAATVCDVEVILPHGEGRIVRDGIAANQRITVRHQAEN